MTKNGENNMKKKLLTLCILSSLCICGGPLIKEKIEAHTALSALETFKGEIVNVYPSNGQTVTIVKNVVSDYIKAMREIAPENDYYFNDKAGFGVTVADYWKSDVNYQKSKNISLVWDAKDLGIEQYNLKLSTKSDLSDAKIYTTSENYYTVNNLYSATTYYWQVTSSDNTYSSVISSFTTEEAPRMLSTGDVHNVRDIGGWMTSSGKRVKQGLIYRGAEANPETYIDNSNGKNDYHGKNLTESNLSIFRDDLKIGLELDFRGKTESNNITESVFGSDIKYERASISAYHYALGQYPETNDLYKKVFEVLANADQDHVYMHCWGGADRTGTIGFLLNGLLGVSYTDLIIDYEITSFAMNFCTQEDIPDNGRYFTTMVNKLIENYSDNNTKTISECIERYLKECIGVSDTTIQALKTKLLVEEA